MSVTVRWHPGARDDLENIRRWVSRDDAAAADRLLVRIVETIESISMPRACPMIAEYDRDDFREVYVASYRVGFVVRGEDSIEVLGVAHASRSTPPFAPKDARD